MKDLLAFCMILTGVCYAAGPPCSSQGEDESVVSGDESRRDGHRAMLALLEKVAAEASETNLYLGDRQAREAREELAALDASAPAGQRLQLRRWLAFHELRLGNNEAAIESLEAAREILAELAGAAPPKEVEATLFDLAVAYMRWGETQNCVAQHTSESCLLPIAGGGVHVDKEGSEKAIAVFEEVLSHNPRHVGARWLLNIAYMTVGRYPDGVPPALLVPPATFESEEEFPRFRDVAPELGLNSFNLCGAAVVDDFDGDDDLDIVTSPWDPDGQVLYFENDGAGGFTEKAREAGLEGYPGGLNMVQADYDNDGHVDVFILRGAWLREAGRYPNSLLRNEGDGTFTDVTLAAGLADVHYPTQTAAWADYDNDGDLDLYVGNESYPGIHAPCQLFENQGDGTFVDVAARVGVTNDHFAKGVVWGDYDEDGDSDLFVSNQNGPNRLYRNDGTTFVDVARRAGVSLPKTSFGTWFWDFDNDGHLDLFVTTYWPYLEPTAASYMELQYGAELAALYKGDGSGRLRNVAREMGLRRLTMTMGTNFGDLDNDGWLDFYLGTGYPGFEGLVPNVMYHNQAGRAFADVTTAGGFGHLQKGHGVAFADLDEDGDQDVFIEMGGAFPGDAFGNALFENPGFGNHWIKLRLEGVRCNRSAIGARIRCVVREGEEERSIYRHVNSGGSFGCNPLMQTIGLGKAERIERIEVYWPTTGRTQVLIDVSADQLLHVREDIGEDEAAAPGGERGDQ